MLRNQLQADLEAIERGEDPKGVIRDPELAACVPWPYDKGALARRNITREQFKENQARFGGGRRTGDYFPFYAGQPEDVRKAYEEAMGL